MADITSKQELMDAFDNGEISYAVYKTMEEDFDDA
jgi:hypothetical protein